MKRIIRKFPYTYGIVAFSLIIWSCGETTTEDSQTHFMLKCDSPTECGGSYDCICGRCTLSCTVTEEDTCNGTPERSSCLSTSSSDLQGACESDAEADSDLGVCFSQKELSANSGSISGSGTGSISGSGTGSISGSGSGGGTGSISGSGSGGGTGSISGSGSGGGTGSISGSGSGGGTGSISGSGSGGGTGSISGSGSGGGTGSISGSGSGSSAFLR